MTRRDDNALLDAAQAHESYCREMGSAIQIAAALVAIAGLLLGCFVAMHLGLG